MSDRDDQGQSYAAGGLALVGCITTAVGIGWLLGPTYILPGTVIGLGLGFLALAVFSSMN